MTPPAVAVEAADNTPTRCLFLPFSEPLLELLDRNGQTSTVANALVPFQLEYECVRLLDGTFDFRQPLQEG